MRHIGAARSSQEELDAVVSVLERQLPMLREANENLLVCFESAYRNIDNEQRLTHSIRLQNAALRAELNMPCSDDCTILEKSCVTSVTTLSK